MLDRPAVEANRPSTAGHLGGRRWPMAFVGCAGLMGAAGVGIGAAAAHLGGSDLARTASDFLLLHAATIVGVSGVALGMTRGFRLLVAAVTLLIVGTVSFSAELAAAGLWGLHPLPLAAPIGGLGMICGWLTLAGAAMSSLMRSR